MLTTAVLLVPAQPGSWARYERLADRSYTESERAVAQVESAGGVVRAQFIAPLAWYSGIRFGWRSARTRIWLDKLAAPRTPAGGYGLSVPFDAYRDGSVNPADTGYTITGAWHVGRALMAGYDGGGVPAERIRQVAGWLTRLRPAAGGRCPAYSDSAHDAGRPCVWNVSAVAAWFLAEAARRGLAPGSVWGLIRAWRAELAAAYRPDLGGWPYAAGGSAAQDAWHNVPVVASMAALDPALGRVALAAHLDRFPGSAANADLLPLDCAEADRAFPAIERTATRPARTPLETLQSRAGYPPLLLLAELGCADRYPVGSSGARAGR
ncbi:hypothetical protein [Pseudonocardia acaciae]|uniref:hypothetical protein n=1 Tax=Pseudonocardia acaciae TaxID=551276 RepID=UPI0012EDE97D|nr:hypothetical protein [Pseudonocardia acaciae]